MAWAAILYGCGSDAPLGPDSHPMSGHASAIVSFATATVEPFGSFDGVEYTRHTGRFEGTTSLGAFRMPYEIIAPTDPDDSNGTVLFEPPHFQFGSLGRDVVLGHALLFGNGYSYATVGFGENGLNVLDPNATDAIIKGVLVRNPGTLKFAVPPAEEIVVQFAAALASGSLPASLHDRVERVYAYGASQTAAALLEAIHAPGGDEIFDLTLLHAALWRPPFAAGEFERLEGEFLPPPGVGRVVFVGTENDQLISDAEQFRRAADLRDYRVYEVAGAAHLPGASNPLDHFAVMRSILVVADGWVRSGLEPPPSTLIDEAPPGEIDPVYGFPTGIARDEDGNAEGGVRLPDLHVGRAQYIALDVSVPGLPVNGTSIDLACEPRFFQRTATR